jgi:hypothetical protein
LQRDLKSLIDQPSEVLAKIAEIGNGPEGFARSRAGQLSANSDIGVNDARVLLGMASYLYNRVTTTGIPLVHAVQQVLESTDQLPPELADEKRQALERILDYKGDYEKGRLARIRSLGNGPHFASINGSWTIAIHETREHEIVKNPVLSMNIAWHDRSGNDFESHFQMTSEEWDEFKSLVNTIDDARSAIQKFLE